MLLGGILFAQILVQGIAAAGAAFIGPMMAPNARSLLLGLALLMGGAGALWRLRAPLGIANWRLPALITAFVATFSQSLGDRTAFLTFALGARSSAPELAAAGAVAGSVAIAGLAIALGESGWAKLPRRALSIAAGSIFVVLGVFAAASGLRLI